MGGSLPVGILIIMIVVGSYVSWEYYKFVIGETTAKISEASYGASLPSVTGVFRLVT